MNCEIEMCKNKGICEQCGKPCLRQIAAVVTQELKH